jgi:hypothetical protein
LCVRVCRRLEMTRRSCDREKLGPSSVPIGGAGEVRRHARSSKLQVDTSIHAIVRCSVTGAGRGAQTNVDVKVCVRSCVFREDGEINGRPWVVSDPEGISRIGHPTQPLAPIHSPTHFPRVNYLRERGLFHRVGGGGALGYGGHAWSNRSNTLVGICLYIVQG